MRWRRRACLSRACQPLTVESSRGRYSTSSDSWSSSSSTRSTAALQLRWTTYSTQHSQIVRSCQPISNDPHPEIEPWTNITCCVYRRQYHSGSHRVVMSDRRLALQLTVWSPEGCLYAATSCCLCYCWSPAHRQTDRETERGLWSSTAAASIVHPVHWFDNWIASHSITHYTLQYVRPSVRLSHFYTAISEKNTKMNRTQFSLVKCSLFSRESERSRKLEKSVTWSDDVRLPGSLLLSYSVFDFTFSLFFRIWAVR